jgi:hypothetical protein
MTKTFDRFLRAFSDEELVAFAQDRSRAHPPYWKVLRLALLIEADRRGLRMEVEEAEDAHSSASETGARLGMA